MTQIIDTCMIADRAVRTVIERLYDADQNYDWSAEERNGFDNDPFSHATTGFSLYPEQGQFLHMLARFGRPTVAVEFATSLGFSALYLASALKANGGGHLYGSELVPEKARTATANLAEAGLSDYATILVGDAREELPKLDGPIDLLLIDGWPNDDPAAPSVALEVLRALEPKLRPGALVVNDNGEEDYLRYVREPSSGYGTVELPWKGETELSIRV